MGEDLNDKGEDYKRQENNDNEYCPHQGLWKALIKGDSNKNAEENEKSSNIQGQVYEESSGPDKRRSGFEIEFDALAADERFIRNSLDVYRKLAHV